ncbi:response regulator [Haloarcula rubripromontorii]|uniref:Response regulator n=1 Tax=Haloarcula rubripromontorii TaxID=1705562 RepID=A0A847TW11_9EURY|nr:response regulator [Haloarcula rubripromontorii]NLV04769.1 response regulator [Haloarcula rubripromontorii]
MLLSAGNGSYCSVPEPITVLHVDDDPDFAELAATFIERQHDRLNVVRADSAGEGRTLLAERDIDCVVSDYDMPRLNGIEFLQALRQRHPDLPFILFTGKGSEEIASEAISAGVTDYLQKGSDAERYELLANRITNAVAQNRAERRAVETTQRYETLFTHTTNAIASVELRDGAPIIQSVNPAFEATFVPPDADVVGRSLDRVITATDAQREQAERITERAETGAVTTREVTRQTVDGPRRFQLQSVPIDVDGTDGVRSAFAVYTDVTDVGRDETPP